MNDNTRLTSRILAEESGKEMVVIGCVKADKGRYSRRLEEGEKEGGWKGEREGRTRETKREREAERRRGGGGGRRREGEAGG